MVSYRKTELGLFSQECDSQIVHATNYSLVNWKIWLVGCCFEGSVGACDKEIFHSSFYLGKAWLSVLVTKEGRHLKNRE